MDVSVVAQDESRLLFFTDYRELDTTTKEIRVLTLLAGSDDLEISCTIAHEVLFDAEPFAALSYCWGAADEMAQIRIDGEIVSIRKNLRSFFWHLRQRYGTLRVWVDYICIDQRSSKERNHQVKLTQDIYGMAVMVYAWLGDACPESEKAVDYIEQVFHAHGQTGDNSRRQIGRSAGLRRLNAIFDREYWTRLWIIQEVMLAQDVQFMIGARVIPLKHLMGIYKNLNLNAQKFEDRSSGKKTFAFIRHLKKTRPTAGFDASLQSLVGFFHHAQCKDPRDRIYGLLGMTTLSARGNVVVDYEASVLGICLRNIDLLLSPNSAKVFSMFDFSCKYEQIYGGRDQYLSELRDLAKEENQLSLLPRRMRFREVVEIESHTLYTFAAKRRRDSQFSPFTHATESEDFDIYVSYFKERNPCFMNILFTTSLPAKGDFGLIQGRIYMTARKCGDSYSIIDFGLLAEHVHFYHSQILEDANEWLEVKVPTAQIECALLPRPDEDRMVSQFFRGHLEFEMNGGAVVELLRDSFTKRGSQAPLTISWDPTCLLDIRDPTIATEVSESLRFCLSKRGCINGSRSWDLLELIRRLTLYRRLDKLYFNATVPRVQTGSAADFFKAVSGIKTVTRRTPATVPKKRQRRHT